MSAIDPYETPASSLDESAPLASGNVLAAVDWQLASRWQRLGAYLLDTLILVAVVVAVIVPMSYLEWADFSEKVYDILALIVANIAFVVINWHLLVTRGQTVGKKVLGIYMVDYTTQTVPPISRVLALRYLPFWFLQIIPIFGDFIITIEALFIFGVQKRCLHDVFASTIVIRDPRWQPIAAAKPREWE